VPYYVRLAQERRLPERFASLEDFQGLLPISSREVVRDDPQQFLSRVHKSGRWRATSGSTGVPIRVYWSHEAHREVLLAKYYFYHTWNVSVFDRIAFLWGHLSSPKRGLAGRLDRYLQVGKNRIRNRIHLSAHDLQREALARYLERIETFQPAAIYAFSSAAHLLALEAEARGWRCDSLRAIFLSGEPAYSTHVQTIERAFRVPTIVEYGSCECGFLAGENRNRQLQVREDLALVETVARADGLYDVVVSVLTNGCFPLLRYALGDTTIAPLNMPRSGFANLSDVTGRNNDVVVTATGRCLHPGRVAAIFENKALVRRFRLHQDTAGCMAAHVEVQGEYPRQLELDLQRELTQLVEGFPVSIQFVNTLPPTATGKHRYITSDRLGA
jgi:phenylacetate-coenzyme A ligase PaaK-like adenylate-forming protein